MSAYNPLNAVTNGDQTSSIQISRVLAIFFFKIMILYANELNADSVPKLKNILEFKFLSFWDSADKS